MQRKIEQIPEEFKTYEEAAEFWDTHDSTEYEDVLEDVEMHVGIQKRHYLIELDKNVAQLLQKSALKKGVPQVILQVKYLRNDLSKRYNAALCLIATYYALLTSKYLLVIYKEVSDMDGFVITLYFTAKPAKWKRIIWHRLKKNLLKNMA